MNILEHERFSDSTGWQHSNLSIEGGDPKAYLYYIGGEKRGGEGEGDREREREREVEDSSVFPDPSPLPGHCYDGEW